MKKLADGNIWMTQNLALVGPFYPDQSDSDVTWSKVTSGDNQTFMLTASDNGTWCVVTDAACINKSMILDSGNTDYGYYYNWYAATAGTGTYELSPGKASSSICPRNWRLPIGDVGGDFGNLYDKYSSSSLMRGVPNYKLSGLKWRSDIYSSGEVGTYWSSSSGMYQSPIRAFALVLSETGIRPTNAEEVKYYGYTVRCLAK